MITCPKCGKELKSGLAGHLKTHKPESTEIPSVETPVEMTEVKEESAAKKALRTLFDNYKIANPIKYELKKEAFQEQLDSMK